MTGEAPLPRAYHTANAVGDCCYIVGGRNEEGWVPSGDPVACFDARRRRWLAPARAEGTPPSPQRSSHRHASWFMSSVLLDTLLLTLTSLQQ